MLDVERWTFASPSVLCPFAEYLSHFGMSNVQNVDFATALQGLCQATPSVVQLFERVKAAALSYGSSRPAGGNCR